MTEKTFKEIFKKQFPTYDLQSVSAPSLKSFRVFKELNNPKLRYSFRVSGLKTSLLLYIFTIDHTFPHLPSGNVIDRVDTSHYLLTYFKNSNECLNDLIFSRSFIDEFSFLSSIFKKNIIPTAISKKMETGGSLEINSNNFLFRPYIKPLDEEILKMSIKLSIQLINEIK